MAKNNKAYFIGEVQEGDLYDHMLNHIIDDTELERRLVRIEDIPLKPGSKSWMDKAKVILLGRK